MKVCGHCGTEISGRDGENLCWACDEAEANGRRVRQRQARREREASMRALGMVKVRGALGGTYWE